MLLGVRVRVPSSFLRQPLGDFPGYLIREVESRGAQDLRQLRSSFFDGDFHFWCRDGEQYLDCYLQY